MIHLMMNLKKSVILFYHGIITAKHTLFCLCVFSGICQEQSRYHQSKPGESQEPLGPGMAHLVG